MTKLLGDLVVVPSDPSGISELDGTVVMLLAPGDARRLAGGGDVEPLDVYDVCDPVDLRRLAEALEGVA